MISEERIKDILESIDIMLTDYSPDEQDNGLSELLYECICEVDGYVRDLLAERRQLVAIAEAADCLSDPYTGAGCSKNKPCKVCSAYDAWRGSE